MLLRALPKVNVYTTPAIRDMLQDQYSLAIGNHGEGILQWKFAPIYPQTFKKINGLDLVFDYSFHTVPSLMFRIYDRPDLRKGKLVFLFSGDTFIDHATLWKNTLPGPAGEAPLMSRERVLQILSPVTLLQASKGQRPSPLMIWDAGFDSIHIGTKRMKAFLEEAQDLGVDISGVQAYHVAKEEAEKVGLPKLEAGPRGALDFSAFYPHFQPSTLEDYVLRVLEDLPLLGSLPKAAKQSLALRGRLEKIPTGLTLIQEGARENSVYVLVDGEIEIAKNGNRIALLSSGLFGEGALLGEPRNASVSTTVPSLVLKLEARTMERFIESTMLKAELEHIRTVRDEAYSSVLKSPLGHLPDSILDLLFHIGRVESYRPGRPVIEQNENSKDVFILLEGEARIHTQEKTLHQVLGPGTMIGEMALVHNAPRNATVTALEPLKVLRFPAERLQHLMVEYPGIGIALTRTAESRRKENGRK
jgi:CRP-like cAMP-binding protein